MKPVKIPSRVDDPVHCLLWSLDELMPLFMGLILGMAVGHATLGFIGGLVITNFYRRFRDNHPDGYLLHLIYWAGFLFTRARSMKNPYVRRYLP